MGKDTTFLFYKTNSINSSIYYISLPGKWFEAQRYENVFTLL